MSLKKNRDFEDDSESEEDEDMYDLPQNPSPQSYHVEYPYLAYKSYQPMNNKVVVLNMQQD
jgi:hypothetical protein